MAIEFESKERRMPQIEAALKAEKEENFEENYNLNNFDEDTSVAKLMLP